MQPVPANTAYSAASNGQSVDKNVPVIDRRMSVLRDVSLRVGPIPSSSSGSISSNSTHQIVQLDQGSEDGSSESSGSMSKVNGSVDVILFGVKLITLVPRDRKSKTSDNGSKVVAPQPAPKPVQLESTSIDKVKKYCRGDQSVLSFTVLENYPSLTLQRLLEWCQSVDIQIKYGTPIQSLVERIQSVQKAKMNRALIEAINGSKDPDFVAGLCLNIESLIKTTEFFNIILEFLIDDKAKNFHDELKGFCTRWVHENRGTRWLKEAEEGPLGEIAKLTDSVKPLVKLPPKAPVEMALNDGKEASIKFDKVLEEISTLEFSSTLSNYAEIIARDLLYYQVQILSPIGEKDVVDKWIEKPQSIQRSLDFQEALSNFIADIVLSYADVSQRARVKSFFVLLCDASRKLGDYQSAMAISGALSLGEIARLKNSWKIIEHNGQIHAVTTDLAKLFDPFANQSTLRNEQKLRAQTGKILPFLGLLQRDIINGEEGGKKIIVDEAGPRYNLDRSKASRKMIRDYLDMIVYWNGQAKKHHPATNFVAMCLVEAQEKPNLDDRYKKREILSEKYQPRRTIASIL